MSNCGMHHVDFGYYCGRCKHKDKKQNDDPCDECLMIPALEYSRKPVHFESEILSGKFRLA